MGRQPFCDDEAGLNRGPWAIEEDQKLLSFIIANGVRCWRLVPKLADQSNCLMRCGKSCRLRWTNYLRPDLKRGSLSEAEEDQIIELHSRLGNRWSKIASHFPGRTDMEIKNQWNTKIKKRLKLLGLDPVTHMPVSVHTQYTPSEADGERSQAKILALEEEKKKEDNVMEDVLSSCNRVDSNGNCRSRSKSDKTLDLDNFFLCRTTFQIQHDLQEVKVAGASRKPTHNNDRRTTKISFGSDNPGFKQLEQFLVPRGHT